MLLPPERPKRNAPQVPLKREQHERRTCAPCEGVVEEDVGFAGADASEADEPERAFAPADCPDQSDEEDGAVCSIRVSGEQGMDGGKKAQGRKRAGENQKDRGRLGLLRQRQVRELFSYIAPSIHARWNE